MADIIISVAAKVAEYLVAPIGRQLSYVFTYRSYLDDLKKQVEQLNDAMTKRQRDVDEAKTQGYDIEEDVQKWLTDTAATKIQMARKFIEDEEATNRSCFNVKSRYQRSREAKKQTRDIEEEIKKNNFSRVPCQPPPQMPLPTGIETFKSRKDTLNQIMEALKFDYIKLIGVWGMGGVGKTTLAKHVMELAEEDKLFDMVVMASNISQYPNVSKIQEDIADMLGLKFDKDEAERVRADRLRTSLNNHKRVLVILDDLWEELRLDQIGIPYGREGCKVLLTSRKRDLLSKAMETQKKFEVKQLSEEEAWSLFKTNAGDAVENLELRPIARQLAKKCDGLPVAIVTIAKALRRESSVAVWKNALDELERCEPTNIEGVSKEVYPCLELSYNYLKGDEVKHLFLLCSMLDSGDIFMDRLLQYAMSLDLFQHNLSLEQAANKLVTLVKILTDSSLLLDTEDNDYYRSDRFFFEPDEVKIIRMHDVVRDVARSIASKDPKQFVLKESGGFEERQMRDGELRNCTHIYLSDPNIKRLPERLVCPKLEFFFLEDCNYPRCLKIPDAFFEEMKQLKVLHLDYVDLRELPSSLNALSNLQTLLLTGCDIGDVAIIGALKQLRVLSFEGSDIQQLSEEMMQLSDLRVLDLSRCYHLKVIPRNIIFSLSRLEFLFVEENFAEWGAKRFDNARETNACLSELTNLSNLKTLVINVGNHNLLPEDTVFQNLNRYKIVVGYHLPDVVSIWGLRVLELDGSNSGHDLINCFSKLLKTTAVLQLRNLDGGKQSFCKLDGEDFPKLKHLCIEESAGIQYVVNSMEWAPSGCAFPILESLDLERLTNLDAVWYGPIPMGSFGHIRKLRLRNCYSLKCVMWLCTSHEREFVFPHLKDIELEYLPQLMYFCSTETSLIKESSTTNNAQIPFFDQQVALPSLESLRMNGLGKVATVWQDQVHAGSFQKLKSLEISGCQRLRNIYETLKIENCGSLDEIIYVESNEEIHDIAAAPLRELSLEKLPFLKSKCSKDLQECASFKNLRVLKVWDCPLMAHLFAVNVAKELENLETLHLGGCEVEAIVADENGDAATPLLFPKLTSLRLNRLGKLRCLYKGTSSDALECPLLKELEVCHCSKVEIVFQGIGSEAEVEADISSLRAPPPLFFVQKGTFANLEKLTLTCTMKIWQDQFSNESFGKLQHLEVECNHNSTVIPSTIIPLLCNVKHLILKECNSIEDIFQVEERPCLSYSSGLTSILQNLSSLEVCDCESLMHLVAPSRAKTIMTQLEELTKENISKGKEIVCTEANSETDVDLVLPKLESVVLRNLPNLRCFGSSRYPLRFPSLREMVVDRCCAMESFYETFSESTELRLTWLPQLTQPCMQISGLYQNLQNIMRLEVWECNNLMYLVTPSMAKSLVQLKVLSILSCNVLTEIVGPEGDDATYDIVFPKLEILLFAELPRLKSFCSASSYALNFPSLEEFSEFGCNEMEFFCGGALTTPRLVKVYDSNLEWDLNTAIKKRAMEKLKISVEEDFEEENSEEEDFEGGDSREEKRILKTRRRSDVEED